ncbi:hypothetical protein SAMN02910358_01573 [Lachnospiraceae bacterium XBB1006]|nr:hypothetical protein SAMN02910358_01573 [Lachnospiraceae bacterium XBB1006]
MLGCEAGVKYQVLVTGNNVVYVDGNCLVSQNISTGEKRNDEMDEMILYTITSGMKENIEANRSYVENSLLFKWFIAKVMHVWEEENFLAEVNDYFKFIKLGISVSREGDVISFKKESGAEILIAEVFEALSEIRA